MKRLVLLATLAIVGAVVPAPAAVELTSCGSTSPAGFSGNPRYLFGSSCHTFVPFGATTLVTMTAQPGPAFTGTLYVAMHKLGTTIGIGANGLYVGGVLVMGEVGRTFFVDAGTWEFEVRAGYAIPCLPLTAPSPVPPIPSDVRCPAIGSAIGPFRGSLTA